MSDTLKKANELFAKREYAKSVLFLLEIIDAGENYKHVYHMIGQCYRFLDNYPLAIHYLTIAIEDDPNKHNYLALGISLQLDSQYERSVTMLKKAISIDSKYLNAYNSLALTYRYMNEDQKSLDTNQKALNILSYQIIFNMKNTKKAPLSKRTPIDNTIWFDYALEAAQYFTYIDPKQFDLVTTITAEDSLTKNEALFSAGLYWQDQKNEEGETRRLFFPNYFYTFKEELIKSEFYSILISGMSVLLKKQEGNMVKSIKYYTEGAEFKKLHDEINKTK